VPTEEEIKKIVDLHNSGLSQGQIAKEMNKGKGTINRVLQSLGLTNGTDPERSNTKRATDAKRNYDRARRLDLNNTFFERLEEFVKNPITARDFKELMVAYGILEDKRQLLEPIKPENENGKAAIIAFVESEKSKELQNP
jgi:IS30 family transposase